MSSEHAVIDFRGYTLAVEYDYFPASRGAREHGTGLQLEPDEPASIEITLVEMNGMEITGLVEEYFDDIEETIKSQSGEY